MAKFRMDEMNDLNATGRRRLYPRMEITGQVDLRKLAREISIGTTFTAGDVVGVVGTLQRKIAQYVADGKTVKIDGIGTFSASLKLRKGCQPEFADGEGSKRNAQSVVVGGVNFRPAKELLSDTNSSCALFSKKETLLFEVYIGATLGSGVEVFGRTAFYYCGRLLPAYRIVAFDSSNRVA